MRWSTLRVITESKAFWNLNALFFLVPLLVRLGLPVGWQLLSLYLAAWLLLAAWSVFVLRKPELISHADFSAYKQSGQSAEDLKQLFEKSGGIIESIKDESIKNKLANAQNRAAPDPEAFWFTYRFINNRRRKARITITAFLAAAVLILFVVNAARFVSVAETVLVPEKEQAMDMPEHFGGTHLYTGKPVEVVRDTGSGDTISTAGTLVDLDDGGYVVVKTPDGKLVYIPKHRVISIGQVVT